MIFIGNTEPALDCYTSDLVNVFERNLLCLVAIYVTGNSSWTNYRLSLRDIPVFKF